MLVKMESETDAQAKIQELEKQVTALKKDNTKLKNEMRFNLEQEKRSSGEYIASLQRDLEALEARNEELTSILMHTEAELKTTQLSQARVESANSAKLAAQSAALVERLSSVQREREKALVTQLRAALEEKEQLQKRFQHHGGIEPSEESSSVQEQPQSCGEDLQGLLNQLRSAKGVFELQKNGHTLVQKVRELKDENRRRIQEQIDMLRKESTSANKKVQDLDATVARLKRQLEIMETEYRLVDKTRVKTLQAQLQAALIEKEEWQTRAAKFEDTCETLRVLSSLQRSLSKEEEIKLNYEAKLQKLYSESAALTDQLDHVLQERNIAVEERNELIKERNAFSLQAQQEFERAERFQRLVFVLRKKAALSSAGTTPPSVTPSFDI